MRETNNPTDSRSPAEIEAIGYLTGAVRGYERAGGSSPVIVVPVGYVRTLLAALAEQEAARRDSDDSARLEPKPEPEMTESEADAIWQEAERNPPSPDSMQRVKDGVMRRLGFEPSAECETAWLIEADGPSWWTGRDASAGSFDADPNEAIRFARREDADRAKHWLLSDHAFALRTTEHMWVDAARQSTPTGATNA